ncbi:MAG: Na+/H+ antiporter subunit E [Gammaproteobacteria bacterium]|nr:Na+/H+ antiporter subunit E [Gammaproteobacteria bacterium]
MRNSTDSFKHKPLAERLALFVISYVMWLMLVWPVSPFDGHLLVGDIVVGVVVAAFVAIVMHEIIRVHFIRLLNPRSWFWLFIYIFVLSYYVIKGGMDVSYRVLHPRMPIRPGIVRIKSILKTDTGRSALANCITLTPGTLTIDVTDDGVFYIHWLNVLSLEEEEAAQHVLRRFEWYIQRIFE